MGRGGGGGGLLSRCARAVDEEWGGEGGRGGYVARSIESQIALHANRLPHALHYWSGSRDDGRKGGRGGGGGGGG